MEKYYLAIDIGASSGRHILGHIENGVIRLEEIHRFPNGMIDIEGSKCWDTEKIFQEILCGMKKCKEMGKLPVSVSVDTWGVDYVFVGKDGKRLGNAVGYRDNRTKGMDAEVYKYISEEELYLRTGNQKQMYNTIYQLMTVKKREPELLDKAVAMLHTPDYYQYLLTGKMASEYTISTTGQLINPETKNWDYELIDRLGLPRHIFKKICAPGTVLGELSKSVRDVVGYNCKVIMAASHDTASAVMAVPALEEDSIFISSGTWSLMGVELKEAICTEESRTANFGNEGGYGYTYRFLKNIMGLWIIQSVRHELGEKYSFAQLCDMAEAEKDFASRIDVNADDFFAPNNMITAIRNYCKVTGQIVPKTPGQLAAVVYQSLAECYKVAIIEMEKITEKEYKSINIIGGGSNADYLNKLTAAKTGKTVYAGPSEATGLGNIVAQMIEDGVFKDLKSARENIFSSFAIKKFGV